MTKRIEMDKKYKTRSGKDVRILCVDAPGWYPVIYIEGENVMSCLSTGKYFTDKEELQNDLIEVSPFAEFKKDDKVMVRDSDDEFWEKRHFSHEKDGRAYCFLDCGTSWTKTQTKGWFQCRKPTPEEL